MNRLLRKTIWALLISAPLLWAGASTANASYYHSYSPYGGGYYYSSPYYGGYSTPYYGSYSSPYYGGRYYGGGYGGYYPYRSYRSYGNYYGNRYFGYHDTPGRGGHFHIGPFRIR